MNDRADWVGLAQGIGGRGDLNADLPIGNLITEVAVQSVE